MAGAKNHDYHILPPSPWPLVTSLAALWLAAGGLMYMKEHPQGTWVLLSGLAATLFCMASWWVQVIKEAHAGDHTPVVQLHLRYGMILFIASEVMFFVGWFWAWFDFALFPVALQVSGEHASVVEIVQGMVATFPPKGMEVLNAFELPLLNTFILLLSGTTVTWAHHGLIHNQRGGQLKGLWGALGVGENDVVKKGLWLTIILGLLFSSIQAYEYAHAPFVFGKSNYYSAF
jgi:cytochrome c oxidase subunit 3